MLVRHPHVRRRRHNEGLLGAADACEPYASVEAAAEHDVRNHKADAFFARQGVLVLELWNRLAGQARAHVVNPRRVDERRTLDCTHWCLPGPVTRVAVRLVADAGRSLPPLVFPR